MDDNSTYVCLARHNMKSTDLLNTIEIKGGNSIQSLSALEYFFNNMADFQILVRSLTIHIWL